MNYSIGEFSKISGLSLHTLRYYEHEGLIEPGRDSGNRRSYTDKDISWIDFIKRLKETGMPIKDITHYAQLRAMGDPTLHERMELLIEHRKTLRKQIELLQTHLTKLDAKIEFYQNEITRVYG